MPHKIAVKDYEWECGDGCCSEQGREWYLNGEFVHRGSCDDSGWMEILKKLGLDAELVGIDSQNEEIWTLQ